MLKLGRMKAAAHIRYGSSPPNFYKELCEALLKMNAITSFIALKFIWAEQYTAVLAFARLVGVQLACVDMVGAFAQAAPLLGVHPCTAES